MKLCCINIIRKLSPWTAFSNTEVSVGLECADGGPKATAGVVEVSESKLTRMVVTKSADKVLC